MKEVVDLWMCFKFSVIMNGNDLNSFESIPCGQS